MIQSESHILNQLILNDIKITSQENIILKSLYIFYENINNVNILISIINSNLNLSIRLINYFVTKFTKYNKISYKITDNNIESSFNIYTSYKQQLKIYQKKYFDPFSRGDRIPYFLGNTCIITTIGQLNFFKWFISKQILDSLKKYYSIIEIEMNKKNIDKHNNHKKTNVNQKKIIYKQFISTINLTKNNDKIIVNFI
jgi:hypothetical protein